MNYYNDNDPYCAQWLRNLIAAKHLPAGDVDDRSIREVGADEIKSYTQCHFFAGIGGWPLALKLAGWPVKKEVWTGSCPCQPFSSATRGRGKATADKTNHLWPDWFRLVYIQRPHVIFGEQVASARTWMDEVCDSLGSVEYTVGAVVSPAICFGADHARERIYFAGYPNSNSKPKLSKHAEVGGMPRRGSNAGKMAPAYGVSPRVGRLRAYGNAVVPQVVAAFVKAFMECRP